MELVGATNIYPNPPYDKLNDLLLPEGSVSRGPAISLAQREIPSYQAGPLSG